MEAINEDVFDLDELEEEELVEDEAVDAVDGSPSASIASSTFLVRLAILIILLTWYLGICGLPST